MRRRQAFLAISITASMAFYHSDPSKFSFVDGLALAMNANEAFAVGHKDII